MTKTLTTEAELLAAIEGACRGPRHLVALCGPPASGKSTLSQSLCTALNQGHPGRSAVVPMDGFHYDNAVLEENGCQTRKGAPHTFDVGGFHALLERLVANAEDAVAIPLFDRDRDLARAGAHLVPRSTQIVIVEGNYLLLDADPWRQLRTLFALTVMIDVARNTLVERLLARWHDVGWEPARAKAWIDGNDLPNIDTVLTRSSPADVTLRLTS